MARSAKLISIDAVQEMAVALGTFGEEALAALDELDMNVRRALDWIEQDRKNFWKQELRRGAERLSEARVDLEKALTYRKMDDYTPACREERAILDKAKRRMLIAEKKNRMLPHWEHRIQHATQELNGRQTQMASWLRSDLPHAISILKQMTLTLERYATVAKGVAKGVAKEGMQKDAPKKNVASQSEIEAEQGEQTVDEGHVAEMTETKELENENMGPTHASSENPPSDEGPGSDQGEDQRPVAG